MSYTDADVGAAMQDHEARLRAVLDEPDPPPVSASAAVRRRDTDLGPAQTEARCGVCGGPLIAVRTADGRIYHPSDAQFAYSTPPEGSTR